MYSLPKAGNHFFFIILLLISLSCNQKACHSTTAKKQLENKTFSAHSINCKTAEKKIFTDFLKELESFGYILQPLNKWSPEYKNHIDPALYNKEQTFIILPKHQIWFGKRISGGHNRERMEVYFDNADVTETVVSKNFNGAFSRDVKLVQFLFNNEEDAQNAEEKMKLISYYTIATDGLKNPNYWWHRNCAIYFCRARSGGTSLKPIYETFEKINGEINLQRWD